MIKEIQNWGHGSHLEFSRNAESYELKKLNARLTNLQELRHVVLIPDL